MDRAAIGQFHQPRSRGFGHIALDGDVTGDLADIAVLGIAIRTVLRVDPAVRQPYGEAFGVDSLAIGIEPHRHGCAGAEGSKKIIIRFRSGILTTNRNRLIRHEQMTSGSHALLEAPAARLAYLDHTFG